jgi:hypothetical protein
VVGIVLKKQLLPRTIAMRPQTIAKAATRLLRFPIQRFSIFMGGFSAANTKAGRIDL